MASFDASDYERKLVPEHVRLTLSRAGLIICGYELLREAVVGGVRGFFSFVFEAGQSPQPSAEYFQKVRSTHQSEYRACVTWLLDMEALAMRGRPRLWRR